MAELKKDISTRSTKRQEVWRAAEQPPSTQPMIPTLSTQPIATIPTQPLIPIQPIATLPTQPMIPALPTTEAIATPPTQTIVEEEIILLMSEVLRPNQRQATRSSYLENVKRMFGLMRNGELHYLNEDACFFKLHLQKNKRTLRIYLVENIFRLRYRNDELNVFENEDIVLRDRSSWLSCYSLFVSIRKHDQKISKGFLIDTKRSGNNRLLEYGGGRDKNIGWIDYKDCNDCVLFYFTK